MTPRRPEVGDEENSPFEILEPDWHHARAGFDAGEKPAAVPEGEHRFPRRHEEKDIPRQSLADRIRGARGRTD
jgi:hypothetical protein